MNALETRKAVQRVLGVEDDGDLGPNSVHAFYRLTGKPVAATVEKAKAVQRLLGVEDDGWIGRHSRAAFDALALASGASEWPPAVPAAPPAHPPEGTEFDARTEQNLATLNANSQPLFRAFMRALLAHFAGSGIVPKLISGTRTCAEQNALFAQGRTAPGPVVTKARCGQSNHNFGCAADVGLFGRGGYLEDSPLYLEIGPLAESAGLAWGGRWKNIKDYPHVEAVQFREKAV